MLYSSQCPFYLSYVVFTCEGAVDSVSRVAVELNLTPQISSVSWTLLTMVECETLGHAGTCQANLFKYYYGNLVCLTDIPI